MEVYISASHFGFMILSWERSILQIKTLKLLGIPCPGFCYSLGPGISNYCCYSCSVLTEISVVSQIAPFSLSVSLLPGSVIFLFFSFSRKKSQNRMVQQHENLMAFPLMHQPIPLSSLNSRVSCIHVSSLQEKLR